MQHTDLPALGEFVELPALLPVVSHSFPTEHSLKWFVRNHRDELAGAGALINITGRLRFHPGRFQDAVVRIGCTTAANSGRKINVRTMGD